MNKSFEYLYTVKANDSIDVEDIGNTCIHVLNDSGYEWYMIIESELGYTYTKTFGPFHVDMPNYFSDGYSFYFSKSDYKESRICGAIDRFINDPKKCISQAMVCDKEEAYEKLHTIIYEEMR